MARSKIAYSYVRFSKPEQSKGRSYDRQILKAKKYCVKNNLTLDSKLNLFDQGISAFRGKHAKVGALSKFLDHIETEQISKGSYLLIESLDRLSRQDIEEAQILFRKILKCGVNIVTLSDEKVYTAKSLKDPLAVIQAILIMSRAHEESKTKSVRISDAWKNKRKRLREEKGYLFTRKHPEWLAYDDSLCQFIPIPEKIKIINDIFRMACDGWGKLKIVNTLNKEGILSFHGNAWATSSVQKLLRNRSLIGEYQPHHLVNGKRTPEGNPIKDYFPIVVKKKEFYYVQSKKKRSIKGPRNVKKINNLFTGRLKCGYCGAPVHFVDKGDYKYLVCSAAKSAQGCPYISFRYDELEASFLYWFENELESPTLLKSEQLSDTRKHIRDLKRDIVATDFKIKENRKKLQKLMVTFADSKNLEIQENYNILVKNLAQEIDALKSDSNQKHTMIEEKKAFLLSIDDRTNTLKLFKLLPEKLTAKQLYNVRFNLRNSIQDFVDYMEIFPGGPDKSDKKKRFCRIHHLNLEIKNDLLIADNWSPNQKKLTE